MLEGIRKKDSCLTKWQSFRLEDQLIEQIEKLALEYATSKSEIYRHAVKDLLKKFERLDNKEETS